MSRITRLSAFAAAAAFLVAAGCQSETTTAADGDGLEGVEKTPDVALLDQAPMRKVVGGDSVSGVRLQCRNWDDSYSIEAGGTELKPDSRGETFLPLPALGDYCEVSIVLTIRTRSTTFRDTLRLDGDCESEDPTIDPPQSSGGLVLFPFDRETALQPSSDGAHLAKVSGAAWVADDQGGHLRLVEGTQVDFGALIADGRTEGAVSFRFRPDASFLSRTASTILGNDAARFHVGIVAGQLFFQKTHDNIHRFVASGPGVVTEQRWYSVRASWGPQGMVLELDGKPVAWSDDVSNYQASSWGSAWNTIVAGSKGWCCMEPLRIGSPLYYTGELDDVAFVPSQPSIWADGAPRSCLDAGTEAVPLCGTTPPVRGDDLW